ncbi:MAG: hypothetical protein ACK4J3_19190, partial [Acinetobacter pittii]
MSQAVTSFIGFTTGVTLMVTVKEFSIVQFGVVPLCAYTYKVVVPGVLITSPADNITPVPP